MSDRARDALEHELKCQCGCTLDVYTCRTTDFGCEVSPAMHRDVVRLVEGGYGAGEILAAFVETYGEIALTAPPKRGFNWVAYLAPGVAMLTGGVLLTNLIKKRGAIADAVSPQPSLAASVQAPDGVSAEDLVRLDRALRGED
jgi:cytochrome c-type biogenesis protein CcmH